MLETWAYEEATNAIAYYTYQVQDKIQDSVSSTRGIKTTYQVPTTRYQVLLTIILLVGVSVFILHTWYLVRI